MKFLPSDSRLIRHDSRGYGKSLAPAAGFTELGDLISVLDRLNVEQAVLVGHSAGGATAIRLALAQPARVRSLVLFAPGVSDFPWPQDEGFFIQFDALFETGDRDGLIDLGRRTWAINGGLDGESQIDSAVHAFINRGEWLMSDPPAFDQPYEINATTRIVIGNRDHPSVVACAI